MIKHIDEENPSSSESDEDEEEKVLRKVALEKKRQALLKREEQIRNCKVKTNVCMQKFCCFKDDAKEFNMQKGIFPTTKQICCWRMLRARRVANQFYTSEETIKSFEKGKSLAIVGWIITINYFAIYTIALLPFIMKGSSKTAVPAAVSTDPIVDDQIMEEAVPAAIVDEVDPLA